MRYLIPLAIILVLIIYFFVLSGDDTTEIEGVFDDITQSVTEKDSEGVLDHFSIHYEDDNGYNYLIIKRMINDAFSRFDSLNASYENVSVNITEDENGDKIARAKVGVKAKGVKGGVPKTLLGTEDSYDDIEVTLKKSTLGSWKIVEIDGVDKHGNH